eukprot:8459980-Alexandrium_andersonii.AAC.1
MNQTIAGITRSYLIGTEDAYDVDVRAQDRLCVWAVRRASWTHSRYTAGPGGHSPHYALTGKEHRGRLVPFGST